MLKQEICASDLYRIFQDNKEEAKSLFVGKEMTISGVVVYTGPDMYGLPSIELSGKVEGNSLVLCVVSADDESKVRKGETVSISGECQGFAYDFVVIKKCKVL